MARISASLVNSLSLPRRSRIWSRKEAGITGSFYFLNRHVRYPDITIRIDQKRLPETMRLICGACHDLETAGDGRRFRLVRIAPM